MAISELKKNWIKRGFSFGIGTIKANDVIDKAFHDDKDELVFMENGNYEFTLGDKTFTQKGKDNVEVLIPTGTAHSIKNLSGKD